MAENVQVTAEIIDGVEQRTAYLLAGLEVPDERTYKFNPQTGTSEAVGVPLELPSGRELLAHLLREGRTVREHPVVIAKEAAICELLLAQPAEGAGNK
jgi:hypothetical protein